MVSVPVAGPVTATASIGVATFPDDGVTADEILLAADRASFAAKRRGRDRIITAAEATRKSALKIR